VTSRSDEPRLLALRSEVGYTSIPTKALPHEPEAISESEQRAMSSAAHVRARQRRLAAFTETRRVIDLALDSFVATVGTSIGRDVHDRVRTVRRAADALGRQL
jgi:hypothetical protein